MGLYYINIVQFFFVILCYCISSKIFFKKINRYFIFSNLLYFKLLSYFFRLEIKNKFTNKKKQKVKNFCFNNNFRFVKTPGILNSKRNGYKFV